MHKLGDKATSEALISELYVELRRRVNRWAGITRQTAQARMGYIGQHLVSIVTGYPGGMSGARGYDLVLPDGHAEIKTCYRVDQLGLCENCGSAVSSIDLTCQACGSEHILRKDDSKWLIGLRGSQDYAECLSPRHYYFVLFEFEDLAKPETIVASIWQVDPRNPGFAYAIIDYKENIKSKSASGAPLNIWPHALKFALMRPLLIYRSKIRSDDTIITELFPGENGSVEDADIDLQEFARSRNLTSEKIQLAADRLGLGSLAAGVGKRDLIADLMLRVRQANVSSGDFADALAYGLYRADIEHHFATLPKLLRSDLDSAGLL